MADDLSAELALFDLEGPDRDLALPVLHDGFSGVYRWHAKRTLATVSSVRAARYEGKIVGVALLDQLNPEVGYVYYIAVAASERRRGYGGKLLDDAIEQFRATRTEVVFAAVEERNRASRALFEARGFRVTERKEPSYRDGGLGAWGLRSRMWVVSGEMLLGVRLAAPGAASVPGPGLRPT